MTAAECERRLDFNADAVDRNAAAIVGAVHDKTAGFNRRQALQAFGDPIGGVEPREAQRAGSLAAGRGGDGGAQLVAVAPVAKIDRKRGCPLAGFRDADRNVAVGESFGQMLHKLMRNLFSDCEAADQCRRSAGHLR